MDTKGGYSLLGATRNNCREECENQVKGFPNARFRKFKSKAEAMQFIGQQKPASCRSSQQHLEKGSAPSIARDAAPVIPGEGTGGSGSAGAEPYGIPYRNYPRKSKECASASRDSERVFVDGSCSNNGYCNSKGGIGVFWGDKDPRNISEKVPGQGSPITNQKAELMAKRLLTRRPP
jgi:ribonuclease HI